MSPKRPAASSESSGIRSRTDLVVLAAVAGGYALLFAVDPTGARSAIERSGTILVRIAPVLVVVWAAIALSQFALDREWVVDRVETAHGPVGYLVAIVTGTLSHGPVYAWYALLADLREQGLPDGLIAVFLYNRAIKLPLLPVFLVYFDVTFAIVLFGTMVVASVIQGLLIDAVTQPSHRA